MEFIINPSLLKEELGLLTPVIERKAQIPVLSKIKMETNVQGELALTATDLDVTMRVLQVTDVLQSGSILVEGRKLYDISRELPKQLDLVVMKNDDASNVKTVLANITSWPVDYAVTGQELIDLFGEPIALGDAFEFSTDVTLQNGTKIAAFPLAGGNPFAPGIYNMPGSTPMLRFAAPCPFDPEAYKADFFVVRDDWADYNVTVDNEDITVTVIDDTHMSFKYKADGALPIIMEVDPLTNAITVAYQKYGTYGGDDYFVESIPGDDSQVDPCTTSISVNLHHSTAAGTFDGVIVMQKK